MNRCYECTHCDDFTDTCENVDSQFYEMDIDAVGECKDFEPIGGDNDI